MMKVVDKMLDWENAGKIRIIKQLAIVCVRLKLLFRKIEDEEIEMHRLKN